MDSAHHNKFTYWRIHCSLPIISGNIYSFIHCIGSMYMSPMELYIDHCMIFYYYCSFTITDPLQGGVLISSNSLTGSSSNSTTATVEDLPTADYHVFQVGIPTVSDHTCQNIIQLHDHSLYINVKNVLWLIKCHELIHVIRNLCGTVKHLI